MDSVNQTLQEKNDVLVNYFEQIDEIAYNLSYSNWMQQIFFFESDDRRRQECINTLKKNMGRSSFICTPFSSKVSRKSMIFFCKTVSASDTV